MHPTLAPACYVVADSGVLYTGDGGSAWRDSIAAFGLPLDGAVNKMKRLGESLAAFHPIAPVSAAADAAPEQALWDCLQAVPGVSEIQIATMLSLSLGAAHGYEARSMLWPVIETLRPSLIVETGTNHGLTSAFLWKLAHTAGAAPRVITFDIERSTLAPEIWKRLGAAEAIHFVQGDSGSAIPEECPPGIEFALIDGDHSFEGARRDWDAIEPLLADRSVVFFDNMEHGAGCGRFFATLHPIWFHPQLAMVVRGLTDAEIQAIFLAYFYRLLPGWIGGLPGKQSGELRSHLRTVRESLDGDPPGLPVQRTIAELCRRLSEITVQSDRPRYSDLMAISAHYGIFTPELAARQRIKEMLPAWVYPLLSRALSLWRRLRGDDR